MPSHALGCVGAISQSISSCCAARGPAPIPLNPRDTRLEPARLRGDAQTYVATASACEKAVRI